MFKSDLNYRKKSMKRYRIGEISSLTGLSVRTIRYFEEEGLLSSKRTDGGQRTYSDQDLVYIKRIMELKGLGFKLSEINRIFQLKKEDESGNKRRKELLRIYTERLEEDRKKLEVLKGHIDELEWHIRQLEKAEDGFTACPGALCASCNYKDRCTFFKSS